MKRTKIIVPPKCCMYCDRPTRRGNKGEHVVPEKLAGKRTLNHGSGKRVCEKCNISFSGIDKTLSSRSMLSIIASQQINAHLWQVWDIDHQSNNTLVEALPVWDGDKMLELKWWPQIAFGGRRVEIRGDKKEMFSFSVDDYRKVMIKAAKIACWRYSHGEAKFIHPERMQPEILQRDCWFLPRVFARKKICQIAANIDDQSFTLRFISDEDRRHALNALSKLTDAEKFPHTMERLSSREPVAAFHFDVNEVCRALMKIGLNLVADCTTNTPINSRNFGWAMSRITGATTLSVCELDNNGFIEQQNLLGADPAERSHRFLLQHINGFWNVHSSFFGGRVESVIKFPGSNNESWRSCEIIAPFATKDWIYHKSKVLKSFSWRFQWTDMTKIIPCFKTRYSGFGMSITRQRK